MILLMIVVSNLWLVAAVAAADSFPITSPQQTDRSVMLAWETHQQDRAVRNSCQWNPSTPTGRPRRGDHARRGPRRFRRREDPGEPVGGHNGCLVYVYNKFEHLYGGRNDPSRLYGCFIGRLRPTVD